MRRNHIEVYVKAKCIGAGVAQAELAGAIHITPPVSID